jgi:5-methyltetrahydrofolate--homocysteine methyltransferase
MLRAYMDRVRDLGLDERCFILVGVGPLASARAARWIRANVPGIHIPDAVIARLEGAEKQKQEGKRLCIELIQEIQDIPGVAGVHVMAYRQEELVAEIVHESGVLKGRQPWKKELKPGDGGISRRAIYMTETVVSSATKEVVIGLDRPFVVIGERINPTGRKLLAEEMRNGDYSRVEADALAQVAAGAQMLDVNAGIPLADEPRILAECVQLVQSLTDAPLSIDSSIVEALESGLSVYQGKALVNSVTGEEERLEAVLPLVKKHGAAVVAISNDETGISEDPDVRFEVARKIVERAADYGIPAADIVVDPLVMPVGALGDAGRQLMRLIWRLRDELRVNTTCGASNFSFGLPNRHGLNAAFLSMAIGAGLSSAITNPLHAEEMTAVMGANIVMGRDRDCRAWIKKFREPVPEGAEPRRRREGRRNRG